MISIQNKKKLLLDTYNLLDRKYLSKFVYLLFLLISVSILEIIGISLIPILISLLLDPKLILEKLSFLSKYFDFYQLGNLDKKTLILYFSLFVVFFYVLKNIFLAFVVYMQGNFYRTIKKNLSNKIFSNYLSADYSFFLSRNSSITIRTVTVDVGNASLYILNIINLLRESLILVSIVTLLLIIDFRIAVVLSMFFCTFTYLFYSITQRQLYQRALKLQILSSYLLKIIPEYIIFSLSIILRSLSWTRTKPALI